METKNIDINTFSRKLFDTKIKSLDKEEDRQRFIHILDDAKSLLPTSLYRYRPLNVKTLTAFLGDDLYISNSKYYNDPYDSLPYIDLDYVRGKISDKLTNELENVDVESVVNVRSIIDDNNNDIINFVSTIRKNPETLENSKSLASEFVNEHINSYRKFVRENSESICFSETNNSIVMWNTYANNQDGFILEYEFDEVNLQNSGDDFNWLLLPCYYTNDRYNATSYYVSVLMNEAFRAFKINKEYPNKDILSKIKIQLAKSNDLSYEKEWRFMKLTSTVLNRIKKVPKAIYLGINLSDSSKDYLTMVAKGKNMKVYQMYINPSSNDFKLEYRLVD